MGMLAKRARPHRDRVGAPSAPAFDENLSKIRVDAEDHVREESADHAYGVTQTCVPGTLQAAVFVNGLSSVDIN